MQLLGKMSASTVEGGQQEFHMDFHQVAGIQVTIIYSDIILIIQFDYQETASEAEVGLNPRNSDTGGGVPTDK